MINPTYTATQPGAQTQPTRTQSAGLASDFETFLSMLTAQAKNQDPLEPLDSSEHASQLAQFSMVEQQVQTNELLSNLELATGRVGLEALAGWVGMNVRSASAFQFDSQPVALFAQADPTADGATLVIRDSNGAAIDRIAVPTNQAEFIWAGQDGAGNPIPAGIYSATLESYDGDVVLSEQTASVYNRVVEAQVADGEVLLILETGQLVPADKVSAIRAGA